MTFQQQPLFPEDAPHIYPVSFPATRYQGSKRKLVEWIWANVAHLKFDTVLDIFGGTGVVSHFFKTVGKQVVYNDYLSFNWQIGLALVENAQTRLTEADLELILKPQPGIHYPDFIQQTFAGIYFTDAENAWLDRTVYHIDHLLTDPYKQTLARFALYQSCIVKRPYNLFHRANLYMRTASVSRSFGNKVTWDTPFEAHFRLFADEANQAVFDNGRANRALQCDALAAPTGFDLVYLDPPYISHKGVGVDYRDFYHFLEGLTDYPHWKEKIDWNSKHLRLRREASTWTNAHQIVEAFDTLIAHHRDSHLVISYRSDGIPGKAQLIDVLSSYKDDIREAEKPQKYVLSTRESSEILLIAT